MRRLIKTLFDDQKYTFTTLTRKQVGAVHKRSRTAPYAQELKQLQQKQEEEGLTADEFDRVEDLQLEEEKHIMDVLRYSLTKHHPDFAVLPVEFDKSGKPKTKEDRENAEKNEKVNEDLQELIDMRDLSIISGFALTGTVQIEEDDKVDNTDITLD